MDRCKFLQLLINVGRKSARHDPEAEGAIVMKATTPEHAQKFNKKYALLSRFYWSKPEVSLQELAHCSSRPRSYHCKTSSSTSDRRYSCYSNMLFL